jgi:hypothetical protein
VNSLHDHPLQLVTYRSFLDHPDDKNGSGA